MTQPVIAVLDYGIGNLHSAQKALEKGGGDARLTSDPALIAAADGVVLPGVGAFGACMASLRSAGLEDPALAAVASGRPFLGICVGMQMLFSGSEEDVGVTGLGVIPGTVEWIPSTNGFKIPQMQWNRLDVGLPADPMLAGLCEDAWVYFVHSLSARPEDPSVVVAEVDYGGSVVAAVRRGNILATQFHPEKSGSAGLAVLRRWADTR